LEEEWALASAFASLSSSWAPHSSQSLPPLPFTYPDHCCLARLQSNVQPQRKPPWMKLSQTAGVCWWRM
jgi:hypothetical protein